jgi:hypothetical protein
MGNKPCAEEGLLLKKVKPLGDKLSEIGKSIDWTPSDPHWRVYTKMILKREGGQTSM